MSANPFHQTAFLQSAATSKQFVADEGSEIAFAGRSNAGKSSALNTLCMQKQLAKVSKTPGRTQLINFFQVNEHLRLVDLPGYGYAKVPEAIKIRWQKTLNHYFSERQSLKGLVLVMDARHPLKDSDQLILRWCQDYTLPCHLLLTKADKLNLRERQALLKQMATMQTPTPSKLCSFRHLTLHPISPLPILISLHSAYRDWETDRKSVV